MSFGINYENCAASRHDGGFIYKYNKQKKYKYEGVLNYESTRTINKY